MYVKHWLFVVIGIIIYLILYLVRALTLTRIYWFFKFKYVSHTTLLIIYGIIGTVFCTLFCVLTTYVECDKVFNQEIINNICFFESKEDENESKYYFDNYKLYFNEFEKNKISLIILEAIFFFFNKYFTFLTKKRYDPVYVKFSIPIIYLLEKLFLILYTLIEFHTFFKEEKSDSRINNLTIFSLDISGDIISLFGFLIYLEIIVFNCYGLSYNTKKLIEYRGITNYKYISRSNNDTVIGPINEEDE